LTVLPILVLPLRQARWPLVKIAREQAIAFG
jgi:hypothetical protein